MNVIAGFFDALADRWDELCYHAPEKNQSDTGTDHSA